MAYSFYVFSRKGKFVARFYELGNSTKIVQEVVVSKLAREIDYPFDGLDTGKRSEVKAYEVVETYLSRQGLSPKKDKADLPLIQYCLDYWDWNGERVKRVNKLKPNSITEVSCLTQYRNFKIHVAKYIPDNMQLSEADSHFVDEIQNKLLHEKTKYGKPISNATLDKCVLSLLTPLKEAYRIGAIRHPVERIHTVDTTGKERGAFDIDELAAILKEFKRMEDEENFDNDVRLAVMLSMWTGMREGEIRALNVSDIELTDEKTSYIHLSHSWSNVSRLKITKGKRERLVPIPTELAQELQERGRLFASGRVFMSHFNDSVIAGSYILDKLYIVLNNIGITEEIRKERVLCFHSLRHSFVTYVRPIVSDSLLGLVVGHRSAKTTDIYTHQNKQNANYLANAAEEVFGGITC